MRGYNFQLSLTLMIIARLPGNVLQNHELFLNFRENGQKIQGKFRFFPQPALSFGMADRVTESSICSPARRMVRVTVSPTARSFFSRASWG